jgi:uncharacterized protein
MKPYDPHKLDVERFATEAGHLEGAWPLVGMHRLVDACHSEELPAPDDGVRWTAAGERRRQSPGESHAWLHLSLDTQVSLVCQRCLGPVETPLKFERWFHFVDGEEQAAALDAESEEDVLASTRALDLHALAEDELLLALPLVPRHEVCPQPLLPAATAALDEDAAPPNPFAALAALKRDRH